MASLLQINPDRLRHNLDDLAQIGSRGEEGLFRRALSEHDLQAREWFADKVRQAGLVLQTDGAANMSALLTGTEPRLAPVGTGSHLDTVPGGGRLDGALGVLSGLEALQCLSEQGLSLRHTVELINFTDEEGRFGGMFGSQAMAGVLSEEDLHQAQDSDGVTLLSALERQGYGLESALQAARSPNAFHAFVELHIEQGPVLESNGSSIGIVEGFAGLFRWNISFFGQPAHSGTTPMDMRRDALQGVAELMREMQRILDENGSPTSVCNVGRIQAVPGAANVVPSQADFTLEVRDIDPQALGDLAYAFRRAIAAITRRRELTFQIETVSEIDPRRCARQVVKALEEVSAELGLPRHRMPSGAVHDSQTIGHIAPSGMLFVPSLGGRSHCPEEATGFAHIKAGTEVLLNTLYRLAR